MASSSLIMVVISKGFLLMILLMDRNVSRKQRIIFLKGHVKITISMGLVGSSISIRKISLLKCMLGSFTKGLSMDMGSILGKMGLVIRGNGIMGR